MRTLAIRKDDRLQVTNAESHFTLPIASDVLAGMCSRDANCWAIVTNAIQTKRNKRTTAVLAVSRRVSAALPGPCPANLLSRRKKAEATSDAPLSLAGWRDSRRTAAARSSRTTPGSRCSSAAETVSLLPPTGRRSDAQTRTLTLSAIPFSSSPISVTRNSSNLCSKRNSEWIFGILITANRRLSGQRMAAEASPPLPAPNVVARWARGQPRKYSIWLGGVCVVSDATRLTDIKPT
jgi:hypothetical protein